MDWELFLAIVNFWCLAINSLILPLSPMSPTAFDITTLLGRSPTGFPIDATLHSYQNNTEQKTIFDERASKILTEENTETKWSKEDIGKNAKNFLNYNTLTTNFNRKKGKPIRSGEHEAFIFYWCNKLPLTLDQTNVRLRTCLWLKLLPVVNY